MVARIDDLGGRSRRGRTGPRIALGCGFIGDAVPVIGVGPLSSLTNATVADIAFSGMIAAFAVIALFFGTIYRR